MEKRISVYAEKVKKFKYSSQKNLMKVFKGNFYRNK